MRDPAALHHALRAAVTLRDKVVVLRLVCAADAPPAQVDELAAHLSLLRALGIRLIVILDTPAPRLAHAISAHGQRAMMLPATGIIHVALPVVGAAALPGLSVTVDPVPLGQLTTLGYIPFLLLPVTDLQGAEVSVAAEDVVAAVGLYLDAALLVFGRTSLADAPPLPLLATGRQTVVTSADSSAGLLSDILLAGQPKSGEPLAKPKARRPRVKT